MAILSFFTSAGVIALGCLVSPARPGRTIAHRLPKRAPSTGSSEGRHTAGNVSGSKLMVPWPGLKFLRLDSIERQHANIHLLAVSPASRCWGSLVGSPGLLQQ